MSQEIYEAIEMIDSFRSKIKEMKLKISSEVTMPTQRSVFQDLEDSALSLSPKCFSSQVRRTSRYGTSVSVDEVDLNSLESTIDWSITEPQNVYTEEDCSVSPNSFSRRVRRASRQGTSLLYPSGDLSKLESDIEWTF